MLRLFAGLALPKAVRARLGGLCAGLPNARWVQPENLHLTLRFIGNVDGDSAQDIDDALQEIHADGFSMRLQGLGFFGSRRRARQIWVGAERTPELLHLQEKIESAIVRTGFPPEGRKFVPHVTLARLRDLQTSRLQDFLSAHEPFCIEAFPVAGFTLYSSVRSSSGAFYRAEAEYPLAVPLDAKAV